MSKVGNASITSLLGQTLAGERTFGHYIYGGTKSGTSQQMSQLQCLYCCTTMSVSSKLCVVWPGNEAMFSLDVLETSVAFEL